ncbi:MAG: TIGR03000 domain-containing protein [Gemmataceae bacterium]|nr:TIGR03000 domain-containing protein [Gemmataceae bacterium]
MRRWLILAALGLAGVLGGAGRADAWGGPYYTQAAFPCVNPPGYYTNLYAYPWMYPWYAHYNYSHGHYQNWWVNGGFATYAGCGPHGCPPGTAGYMYPIPGYTGGPVYGGPPYVPGSSAPSSHAGGPNGVWLQGGPGVGTVTVNLPADAKLQFNGTPAEGSGMVRTFQTPPLEPGQDYAYTLTAEVVVNGEVRQVSEKVVVRAGGQTTVTLAAK